MNKVMICILFLIVSITWGTTWIAMKIALMTIPPLFVTSVRFLITALILMLIGLLTGKPLLFPPGKKKFQLIMCIFYFLLPFTLMLYGGAHVSSSLASIIFSTMPVLIFLFSYLIMKEKICIIKVVGLIISLSSLLMILLSQINVSSINQLKGIIALLLALISHALIYSKSKKEFSSLSIFTLNTLPSFFSGIILLLFSIIFEKPNLIHFSKESMFAILYLGNISGVFGILAYFYLQTKISIFKASIIFLIFPFISIFLEYIFFGSVVSMNILFMFIILVLGILLTLLPCKCQKKKI
ncbi:EamA-like transporter family protein [Buchnera aphidicola (Eriosoma grossulariae)]|uniref:DMT family transporter n=1 Tax=Buchnera aphidicola TaxID=9 RepID=UPI0034639996